MYVTHIPRLCSTRATCPYAPSHALHGILQRVVHHLALHHLATQHLATQHLATQHMAVLAPSPTQQQLPFYLPGRCPSRPCSMSPPQDRPYRHIQGLRSAPIGTSRASGAPL